MPVAKGVRVRQRDRDALMRIAKRDVVDKVAARANGLLDNDDGPVDVVLKMSSVGALELDFGDLQRMQVNVAANLAGLEKYHADTFEDAVAEVADILKSQVPRADTTAILATASDRTTEAFGKLPERARLRILNTSVKAAATESGYGAFGLADIQQLIDETVAVNLSQAESLSGDAVSRYVGEASQFRQEDIGIDSYGWLSRRDDLVRETHAANDGFTFRWDLPPIETGPPGADYFCRCISEPDLSESLIESLQAGAEEFITAAAALPPEGGNMDRYPETRSIRRNGDLIHVRQAEPFELRQEGEDFVIEGYGLRWDVVADIGYFTESFRKGAFADTLDDVRLKIGHDYRRLALARSPQTMTVTEDDVGLRFRATLAMDNPDAQALASAVARGDVDKSSVGFSMGGDYDFCRGRQ